MTKGLVVESWGALMASVLVSMWAPLHAQQQPEQEPLPPARQPQTARDPGTGLTVVGNSPFYSTFPRVNVLATGQPVVPLFEGWAETANDSILLSFSYINLNYAETLDIPIGPNNFIEPSEFNGAQPTHFDKAPQDRNRYYRHQSTFTVRVPRGYTGDVVWTLRNRDQTFSVPGRATSEGYAIDDTVSLTNAPVAAAMSFDPSGPPKTGRVGPTTGPLTARVGGTLPLSVWVDATPEGLGPSARPPQGNAPVEPEEMIVTWYHHQGPGEVTFSERETMLGEEAVQGGDPVEVSTTATFSEPGEYVLRVTAIENLAGLVQHCCWTNGYVGVTVSP
ncbi:MAG: hypothetical protein OEU26_27180 [Candidatus Tectomicrobia bacterium]|nr:hypothetical protein [Candidatus Tectomicrobia bacterium]